MIWRSLGMCLGLFLAILIDQSFLSALPGVLHFVPLVFIIGVLFFHFLRPNIGCVWLVAGGILLDLFGLPSVPRAITYSLAGLSGLLLARHVFQNRSVYAMMGLGGSMYAISIITEELWTAIFSTKSATLIPFTVYSQLFWTRLITFSVSLFIAFLIARRLITLFRRLFFLRT